MNITVDLVPDLTRILKTTHPFSERSIEIFAHYCSLGETWVGRIDGQFICCWGLVPPSFLANQAFLWMWAPPKLQHPLVFIRHSQIHVQRMLKLYDEIAGECEVHNLSAHRWLRWLGATFTKQEGPLMSFTIRRPHG
jgi:hypothetical protein